MKIGWKQKDFDLFQIRAAEWDEPLGSNYVCLIGLVLITKIIGNHIRIKWNSVVKIKSLTLFLNTAKLQPGVSQHLLLHAFSESIFGDSRNSAPSSMESRVLIIALLFTPNWHDEESKSWFLGTSPLSNLFRISCQSFELNILAYSSSTSFSESTNVKETSRMSKAVPFMFTRSLKPD